MSDVISLKISGLAELLQSQQGKDVDRGVKRGLKKVGDGLKTRASQLIRDTYNLKKDDVDSKFEVIATSEQVLIVCKSRPVNLTMFNAKQLGSLAGKRLTVTRSKGEIKRTARGKAGAFAGVTAAIEKDHTSLLSGAFIAQVKAGSKGASNIGVFSRVSHSSRTQYKDQRNRRKTSRPYVKVNRPLTPAPRQAIINRAFVSVSTLFLGKRVAPALQEYLDNDALRIVEHEIDWAIRGER